MSDEFNKAFAFTFKNEGGFVNDPVDRGGATNFGITLRTLQAWRSPKLVTEADVKALTPDEAKDIYFSKYWITAGCDKVTSTPVAIALFDTAVVSGPQTAVLYAQLAVNVCLKQRSLTPAITVDGRIGPTTQKWLSAVQPADFLDAYIDLLLERVAGIIERHPEQKRFERGWRKRIQSLEGLTPIKAV